MDVFDLYATIGIKLDDFERGLNEASSKFKSFSNNLSKAGSGMKDLLSPVANGFKAVESVGQKAGSAITTGLKGFAAASTAVAGFGTAAVNSGMKFDATMSKVSAVSGATGEEFDSLRNKALEMGAKTKFSASEAGEAMTYMAMAGWKAGDMIGGIEGIMNLAAASGEDLATTSDIVTDALTAFGYTAADSTRFADVLAVASSNANTNVGMMGETFKYVAPVAGTLGYSIEDTALAIGLMANSGIKASSAGTSLRAIFNRLATDTGASSKSLGALGILTQKLGVEFYNADGSARDFNKVLLESRDAWKELTVQEQENYAKKIAGEEAGSAWMAMMNASNEDVQKLTASIEECNGASAKMAETMSDNLQGDIDRLGSAFESLQIAISDSLTPTLREFAQFGQKAMANLLEGFQSGGITGLMQALSSVVTDAVNFLSQKAPEFAKVSVQFIGALGEGLLNSAPNILTAGGEIISTLVTGLSDFLSQHSTEMVEIGRDVIDMVSSGFKDAVDVVTSHIGEFIPLLAEGFVAYHETLFTVGMEILGAIGKGIVEHKEGIAETASKTIANMVAVLQKNAPSVIEGAFALIEALIKGILDNIDGIAETAKEIVPLWINGLTKLTPLVLDGAAKIIIALAEGLIAALPELIKSVPLVLSAIVDTIVENLPKILELGAQIVLGLAEGIVVAIPELLLAIPKLVEALIDGFCELLGIHSPSTVFAGFGVNIVEGLLNGIKETFGSVVEFFGGAVDDILGLFAGLPSQFLSIGGNIVQGIWDGVSGAWGSFTSWLNDKVGGIVNGVKSMLGIHSPSTVFAGIGENMALGLAEGWGDQYSSIKRQIENGMNFGTATVGLNVSGKSEGGAYGNSGGQPSGQFSAGGNFTVNIYNPEKRDAVTEAREWKKTAQRIAIGYA